MIAAEEEAAQETSVPTGAIVSRGSMATKTGFVLARAKLAARSSTGVVAAQERHTALVGKGKYCEEEKVAQEQPVKKSSPPRTFLLNLRHCPYLLGGTRGVKGVN